MTDENPIKTYEKFSTKYVDIIPVYTDQFRGQPTALQHAKYIADPRVDFAMKIMGHFALIAGREDGEDKAGRQKLRSMDIEEIVMFSCGLSDAAFNEFEKRGWFEDAPSYDEIDRVSKLNSERN